MWVVFELGKMVFLGFVFEVLIVLWFVFCVFGFVAKMLKICVFPVWVFCVMAYSCLFGFGRLGVNTCQWGFCMELLPRPYLDLTFLGVFLFLPSLRLLNRLMNLMRL